MQIVYLEILNDLGWVGLLCLIAYIVVHVWQSVQLMDIERAQGALYLGLFFQQAITNLSETHWFSVLSIDFVIMTLATVALARGILEYRLRLALGDQPRAPLEPVPRSTSPVEKSIARAHSRGVP